MQLAIRILRPAKATSFSIPLLPQGPQTSQPQGVLFSQHSKGEGNQEGTPSDGRGASAPSKVPGKAPGSTQVDKVLMNILLVTMYRHCGVSLCE